MDIYRQFCFSETSEVRLYWTFLSNLCLCPSFNSSLLFLFISSFSSLFSFHLFHPAIRAAGTEVNRLVIDLFSTAKHLCRPKVLHLPHYLSDAGFQLSGHLKMFDCPICVEDKAASGFIDLLLSLPNPPALTYNHRVYVIITGDLGLFGAFKIIHIQLCVKEAGRRHTVDCSFIDLLLPAFSKAKSKATPHHRSTMSHCFQCLDYKRRGGDGGLSERGNGKRKRMKTDNEKEKLNSKNRVDRNRGHGLVSFLCLFPNVSFYFVK